jgi:hypothetical protein
VSGRQVELEPYGICVTKKSVREERGNQVLYVNWPASKKMGSVWDICAEAGRWEVLADIMPFVSKVDDDYDFHWEREWRIPESYQLLGREDLIILCPEHEIASLRAVISGDSQLTRWYEAIPIVDPSWRPARIIREMSKT